MSDDDVGSPPSPQSDDELGRRARDDNNDNNDDDDGAVAAMAERALLERLMAFSQAKRKQQAVSRSPAVALPPSPVLRSMEPAEAFRSGQVPLLRTLWNNSILVRLDSAALRAMASVCLFFYSACNAEALWEARMAVETPAPCCLVQPGIKRWKDRFRVAQHLPSLTTALAIASPDEELVVLPGVHLVTERTFFFASPFKVSVPIHLVGCGFNKRYYASPAWGHKLDVEQHVTTDVGNVLLYSDSSTPMHWEAPGGSIRNMDIRFLCADTKRYFFALKMEKAGASLYLENVGVQSTQHAAVCLTGSVSLRGRGVRITGAKGTGITVSQGAECALDSSLIDYNAATGAEVRDAKLVLQDCVLHNNTLNGVGANGKCDLRVNNCAIFGHRLNGVEADALQPGCVARCNIHDNLHGILSWQEVAADETLDVAPIEHSLRADNTLHNRFDVRCKTRLAGASPVDTALAQGLCTFCLTGPHFYAHPNMYGCRTCGIDGREGLCGSCAKVCHAGHEIVDHGFGEASCPWQVVHSKNRAVNGFFCDDWSYDHCTFKAKINEVVEHRVKLGSSSAQ